MHCQYTRIVPGARTAVVMIHGILGSPAHFRAFEAVVPGHMSVVNLLLDGHGKTAADFSKTSMEKWKFQLRAAVQGLAGTHERILILGHSMGTLLALHAAQENPQVAGLFLLAPPLKICPRLRALTNALRVAFDRIREDDPAALALRDCPSVKLTRNPFAYLGWIPRYLELFRESAAARAGYAALQLPCQVWLSKNDELVCLSSRRWMDENANIDVHVLENSSHSYYAPQDMARLKAGFARFLAEHARDSASACNFS